MNAYQAEPLHFECCMCHALSTGSSAEFATGTLLIAMLRDGVTAEDWRRGLCFAHRRRVDDCVAVDPGKGAA
jgi:hypothetical protein